MALEPKLKFEQCSDCSQLQVTDDTGAYDATDNTGGWGAPNVLIANVTSAILTVLLPGKVEGQDEITIDLQTQIPSKTFQFKILKSQSFGLPADTNLPDGTYVIDYEVIVSSGSPTNYKYHTEITLFCVKGTCVNSMLIKIAETGCDCNTTLIDAAVEANTVLCAMAYAATVQRSTEVTELGKLLDKLCKVKDDCLTC